MSVNTEKVNGLTAKNQLETKIDKELRRSLTPQRLHDLEWPAAAEQSVSQIQAATLY
jgi:hypothetical protein